MQTTHPCGRNQETAWLVDIVIERPHHRVQVLDAHPIQFAPRRNFLFDETAVFLRIECQHRHAQFAQTAGQRLAHTFLIHGHNHTALLAQHHTRWLAQI